VIGFVGLGKLGLPCALAIEGKGYQIIGCDTKSSVGEIIRSRKLPYREAGAQEALETSSLLFGSMADVVEQAKIIFVAVQTPHEKKYEGVTRLPDERENFDYSHLKGAVGDLTDEIGRLGESRVVVIISTVLPGTIRREIIPLLNHHVRLCYNPFFIAMGTTMRDFLQPEFVLLGADDSEVADIMRDFYATIHDAPVCQVTIEEAELIKVAYNTFIGMKIVFANVLMEICHKLGMDVDVVTDALKMAHQRLISGSYLSGGMGDGGGCHPRDNIALSWLARELNLSCDWFEALMLARERQTEWLADLMEAYDLPKVILGRAFKAGSNLEVGSPAILLKNILEERGHEVKMYDPHIDDCLPDFPSGVYLIGTKHPEFLGFVFPAHSVVIDPWRYIPDGTDYKVIRIGEHGHS